MALRDWFVLSGSGKYGAFVAYPKVDCRRPAAVLWGEESVPVPMEFEHHTGGRVYDWISGASVSLILISRRMQEVLKDGGFAGWRTIPSVVHHNEKGLLEGYGCLVITGRAGPIAEGEAALEKRPSPFQGGHQRMVRVGLHVDFSTWDGSDICTPEGRIHVLASRAVKDALVKAKITGVEFTRLDQYEARDEEATRQLWKEMGYE